MSTLSLIRTLLFIIPRSYANESDVETKLFLGTPSPKFFFLSLVHACSTGTCQTVHACAWGDRFSNCVVLYYLFYVFKITQNLLLSCKKGSYLEYGYTCADPEKLSGGGVILFCKGVRSLFFGDFYNVKLISLRFPRGSSLAHTGFRRTIFYTPFIL